ncbi:sugar-transfer associated ATP-grasp domain-containing protein [Erysipelothrix urinaevulpis]|uniref:sugar-transfer associated ATP-grasp domain-containing protein n=1 Tax=Erysipelothrix urinaevulpis TaxID=2683717 RepID=UPI00135BA51F|nr:sugar-transfer associated ATP-grasp domain-containing protein [Erysipelothrix urinaevulpis]
MKRIINRFKRIDTKLLKSNIKEISQLTGKSQISVFMDMLQCYKKYGAGYSEYFEYEFYLLNEQERSTYMTSVQANEIVQRYNQKEYRHLFYDKADFNKTFADYVGRDWLNIQTASKDDIDKFLENRDTMMIKETQNLMGHGVEKITISDIENVDEFVQKCLENKQYLWEEFFTQHTEMARLYPGSVNTLRVITFFDGDEVAILEKVLKIGNGGHLDNFAAGGMYTILSEEGKVLYPAFDAKANAFSIHPSSQVEIIGFEVPHYDKVVELVKNVGRQVPQIPYVGWDIAIGQEGPILIEGNYNSGVFQMKPSITKEKVGVKPHYKKYIDF